jgi:hypothetical protein
MDAVTTLKDIEEHTPCKAGWHKLLEYLNKTEADNEPLPLSVVLTSNGLDDALWCLRVIPAVSDIAVRQYTVWCARQAQYLMRGEFVCALDTADKFIKGEIDYVDLANTYVRALRIPRDYLFVTGMAEAEAAAMSTLALASMHKVMTAAGKAADAQARYGAALLGGSDASYATAFAAARASQTLKFREMFCTDSTQSTQETMS